MWAWRTNRAQSACPGAVGRGEPGREGAARPATWRTVRMLLGSAVSCLVVAACGGDSLELEGDFELFGGDDTERSYDTRYAGTGSITVSGAGDAVCSQSIEATLGLYDDTGFGRLRLTYPGPGLRFFKQIEREWVCQDDPAAFNEQTETYTTDEGVDGRYLFDLDVPLSYSDFHEGILEVVVTGAEGSLSGQATAGPLMFDIAIESMNRLE